MSEAERGTMVGWINALAAPDVALLIRAIRHSALRADCFDEKRLKGGVMPPSSM